MITHARGNYRAGRQGDGTARRPCHLQPRASSPALGAEVRRRHAGACRHVVSSGRRPIDSAFSYPRFGRGACDPSGRRLRADLRAPVAVGAARGESPRAPLSFSWRALCSPTSPFARPTAASAWRDMRISSFSPGSCSSSPAAPCSRGSSGRIPSPPRRHRLLLAHMLLRRRLRIVRGIEQSRTRARRESHVHVQMAACSRTHRRRLRHHGRLPANGGSPTMIRTPPGSPATRPSAANWLSTPREAPPSRRRSVGRSVDCSARQPVRPSGPRAERRAPARPSGPRAEDSAAGPTRASAPRRSSSTRSRPACASAATTSSTEVPTW